MATESGTTDFAVGITARECGDRAVAARAAPSATQFELEERPGSFEFFQAVRFLELLLPDTDALRFRSNPRLDFPPSQIESINISADDAANVTVNFLGLVGPMGALPYFYSELVTDRLRAKDSALQAFLDIFQHRLIKLFYQAWQKHRFPVGWEQSRAEGVTSALRALLGLHSPGLLGRQEIADDTLLFYTGLLAMQTRPAAALEQIIADYFRVPAAVEQFSGAWCMLPSSNQCRLGNETCFEQLGLGSVLGDAVWNQQSRVTMRLGPMPLARYRDFLPAGSAYRELEALVEFYANRQLDFDIQLVLDRSEVPTLELGAELPLGWCSWLRTEEFASDPEGAMLQVGQQLCM
ncbi:MAG TPA: type VI secretion system baseplate subunit TssG [Bryobacteraceae bacterium]